MWTTESTKGIWMNQARISTMKRFPSITVTSLTSLPLASAKPPPRSSTMPQGNFFWTTFQVSRRGVGPAACGGATNTDFQRHHQHFILPLKRFRTWHGSPVSKLWDFLQQKLGALDGRTKRRIAMKMATVASVTYLKSGATHEWRS